MDIAQKVKEIVVERLGVSVDDVVPTARFQEDLNADSLDVVELIMSLEEEFGISIPDEDVEDVRCVQDAINYLTKKLQAGEGDKSDSAGVVS